MNIVKKTFLVALSVVMTVVTCASCGGEQPDNSDKPSGEEFLLQHFNGMDVDEYDTSLLWRNTSEVVNDGGGDGDVMWVSEEDDPVYGGWFYMYSTYAGNVPSTEDGKTPTKENGAAAYYGHVLTSRSKDMVDWEMCGTIDGCYSLKMPTDSWALQNYYAPECIFDPVSKRYFLYFSAASKVNNGDLRELGARYSDSPSMNNRFYIGVAVSDSPCGPFELVSSENMYGDATKRNPNGYVLNHINPTIMVDEECDELFYTEEFRESADFASKDEIFSVIDAHPFFDVNGDLYLYFCRHMSEKSPGGHNVWGVKMKDMVTPDWTTLTCLFRGTYSSHFTGTVMLGNPDATLGKKFVRTEYAGSQQVDPAYPRHLGKSWKSYTTYADGTESTDGQNEYNLVEAPNMIMTKDKDGKTVYVMSYAPIGVDIVSGTYDMKAAYAYSPLGPFIKPNPEEGATILGVDGSVNDFMSNLGHASFVTVGDEIWIAHWQRQTPFGGLDQGRLYALSGCSFQYIESTGIYMPVGNGPSTALQPLTSVATGYKNVALGATITATNVKGDSVKYLNDGMAVTRGVWSDNEFKADKGTKIKITFDKPTAVRGVLVYNSYSTDNAFKSISLIQFDLAEKPIWHTGNEKGCYISDLPYNVDAYQTSKGNLQPGSAAVATFNEIKVNSITVTIKESDLYKGNGELRLSEIVVLGK